MKRHQLAADIIKETRMLDRFLEYVREDTQAVPGSETFPSSMKEKNLGAKLVEELKGLGIDNAEMDENGYVYAKWESNCGVTKKVAFIAHMDVATDCAGEGVKPVIHEKYDGSVIKLNGGTVIDPDDSEHLKNLIGDTVITSDGTTLLGADDKAGVAAIMSMIEYLKKHPDIKRPEIRVCFTPDEEIGRGVDFINLKKVDADFAYTLDGGTPYEVNYENFNAYGGKVTIKGVSIHPGYAKDKMVNAIRYAGKFIDMLPKTMSPERTHNREPFIHPVNVTGGSEEVSVSMILRSFVPEDIDREKQIILNIIEVLKAEEPRLEVKAEFKESYLNMYEIMKDKMYVYDYVKKAIEDLGATPDIHPIRGGTDGARLSFMGLPCPNIFAGGVNFHSQKEFVALEDIGLAAAVAVKICENIK
ncbi:MAG TPA: peptidase T [bacterium]|nr:peptidase T [bacterium]